MKKVKKFLSVLCAACMAITLLPSAMAADLPSEPNVYRLISAQEFNSIAPRSRGRTRAGLMVSPAPNSLPMRVMYPLPLTALPVAQIIMFNFILGQSKMAAPKFICLNRLI